LLLVPERALQLVLVHHAELGEQLSQALARRHQRFTRARYSSRENTPFSINSSTIALSAATERRCVSSTPRSTSTADSRGTPLPAAAPSRTGGAEAGGAFLGCLRGSSVTTDWPLLLTIFMLLCSPSAPSSSSPRYQREMALRIACAPASGASMRAPGKERRWAVTPVLSG